MALNNKKSLTADSYKNIKKHSPKYVGDKPYKKSPACSSFADIETWDSEYNPEDPETTPLPPSHRKSRRTSKTNTMILFPLVKKEHAGKPSIQCGIYDNVKATIFYQLIKYSASCSK